MNVFGIDGISGGWIVARFDGVTPSLQIYRSLSEWGESSPTQSFVLIDMPIGLPDRGRRACDTLARNALLQRKSSLFTAPCRGVLTAPGYEEACQTNLELQGIKISRQVWNIVPKIREVDDFLSRFPLLSERLKESHPELCFQFLNGGTPLAHSKKSREGREERARLLSPLFRPSQIERALASVPPSAHPDALDALALVTRFHSTKGNLEKFGDGGCDRFGRKMEIVA